jgi:hypothetical protein
MGAQHKQLTEHTKNFLGHLTTTQQEFCISDYTVKKKGQTTIVGSSMKFCNMLILIVGREYIFVKRDHKKMPYGRVTLKSVETHDGVPYKITIVHTISGEILDVVKECINPGDILEPFYKSLTEDNAALQLYQFPVSPLYTCTYHNAQGLTIENSIDMNITRASCESIYVGLSRIKKSHQLNSIQMENVNELEYTFNKQDAYFYSIRAQNDVAAHEVLDIKTFEDNRRKNIKILKSTYYKMIAPSSRRGSRLIRVCEYIKNNLNTIKENFDLLTAKSTLLGKNPMWDNFTDEIENTQTLKDHYAKYFNKRKLADFKET